MIALLGIGVFIGTIGVAYAQDVTAESVNDTVGNAITVFAAALALF